MVTVRLSDDYPFVLVNSDAAAGRSICTCVDRFLAHTCLGCTGFVEVRLAGFPDLVSLRRFVQQE